MLRLGKSLSGPQNKVVMVIEICSGYKRAKQDYYVFVLCYTLMRRVEFRKVLK